MTLPSVCQRLRQQATADCDWPVFNTPAPAGRLARPIADPAEDPWKYVRLAILDVRVAEAALGNEPDVLWYVGVGRTCPLAVDDLMKVIGIGSISRFHFHVMPAFFRHATRWLILCWPLA